MEKFKYKMTPQEFMRKVVELYQVARIPQYYHPKVRRGRSHSIAGKAEDLVAAFLGFNLIEDFDIYVDQPITFGGDDKRAIYADIALLQSGELKQIVDVKMDLGWMRTKLPVYCDEKRIMIRGIRGRQGNIRDGITKKQRSIVVSGNCSYHIVIVSGENISRDDLNASVEKAREYEPEVAVYLLSSGIHPNQYGITEEELLSKLRIHNESFDHLLRRLVT